MQKNFCAVQYFLAFTEFPTAFGLLESLFRAIGNRSRVYPPMAGLSAVILVRRFCGGVADCPADHLMAASFIGVKIHSDSLLQLPDLIYKTYVPSSYIETSFFNTYLLMPNPI
jgi:hypothetical protein